jgi:hypothetical protein
MNCGGRGHYYGVVRCKSLDLTGLDFYHYTFEDCIVTLNESPSSALVGCVFRSCTLLGKGWEKWEKAEKAIEIRGVPRNRTS